MARENFDDATLMWVKKFFNDDDFNEEEIEILAELNFEFDESHPPRQSQQFLLDCAQPWIVLIAAEYGSEALFNATINSRIDINFNEIARKIWNMRFGWNDTDFASVIEFVMDVHGDPRKKKLRGLVNCATCVHCEVSYMD